MHWDEHFPSRVLGGISMGHGSTSHAPEAKEGEQACRLPQGTTGETFGGLPLSMGHGSTGHAPEAREGGRRLASCPLGQLGRHLEACPCQSEHGACQWGMGLLAVPHWHVSMGHASQWGMLHRDRKFGIHAVVQFSSSRWLYRSTRPRVASPEDQCILYCRAKVLPSGATGIGPLFSGASEVEAWCFRPSSSLFSRTTFHMNLRPEHQLQIWLISSRNYSWKPPPHKVAGTKSGKEICSKALISLSLPIWFRRSIRLHSAQHFPMSLQHNKRANLNRIGLTIPLNLHIWHRS